MNKLSNFVLVLCSSLFSFNSIAELQGKHWQVRSGDTLYGIGRAVFPSNTSLQSKLRSEIINLNQEVFKKGSGSLYIGAKLVLPAFAVKKSPREVSPVEVPIVTKVIIKPQNKKLLEKNEWLIKSGDSLYSIARAFYPRSSSRQFKLRKEIVRINPSVFRAGANRMKVGIVLIMPSYLVKSASVIVKKLVATEKTVAPVINTLPETQSIELHTNALSKAQKNDLNRHSNLDRNLNVDSPKTEKKYDSNNISGDQFTSELSFSAGFSVGGDVTVMAQGGRDLTYGSGFNFRASFDGLWEKKQGYRFSLGYQVDKVVAGNDSGQLEQMYLHTMYLYNSYSSLMGVGLAYHNNISRETNISAVKTTTDFEPAAGLILMYEYKRLFGDHVVGLSYTQLESESTISLSKVDMSRTEIYYKWAF